jgi:hypothetical protein
MGRKPLVKVCKHLNQEEITRLLTEINNCKKDYRDFFLLALHTGEPAQLIAYMPWLEIDLKTGSWTRHTFKGKYISSVMLSSQAMEVLNERLSANKDGCPYVFGNKHTDCLVENYNREWANLRAKANLKDFNLSDFADNIEHWRKSGCLFPLEKGNKDNLSPSESERIVKLISSIDQPYQDFFMEKFHGLTPSVQLEKVRWAWRWNRIIHQAALWAKG